MVFLKIYWILRVFPHLIKVSVFDVPQFEAGVGARRATLLGPPISAPNLQKMGGRILKGHAVNVGLYFYVNTYKGQGLRYNMLCMQKIVY